MMRLTAQIPLLGDAELCALFKIVEKVAPIISRGHIYEWNFTPESTPREPLENFQSTLLRVYIVCLELLADATRQLSSPAAKQYANAILNPGKMAGKLSKLAELEIDLHHSVQACESSRSLKTNDLYRQALKDLTQSHDAALAGTDCRRHLKILER